MEENMNGIIVAVNTGDLDFDKQIDELRLLCSNIGIDIQLEIIQKRNNYDKKYYIGKGKFQDLVELVKTYNIDVVVFNDALSNSQRRNIQNLLEETQIIDRNEVILEIFKRNARTAEAKLQVELATLTYELPKLIGMGKELSRIGGGARGTGTGTRGSGETLLEYRRRNIKDRISHLKKELDELEKVRKTKNKKRNDSYITQISILGYTSAGKSTLLKGLTNDNNILISKKLFSTLSTLTRKVVFPSGLPTIFSDTVGFIRKLPVKLIESFKSTLDEINYADAIIELIDISEENFEDKLKIVDNTIDSILVNDVPKILVFNKIDKLSLEQIQHIKILYPNALLVSAKSKESIHEFLLSLENKLLEYNVIKSEKVFFEFKDMWKLEKLKENIGIKSQIETKNGYIVEILAKENFLNKLKKEMPL
ncbi:GTPase HflX [Marinitoga litoralis]|uniref:GTPase HflX n=1 Tax=Marinitoga litoralis TaxID=570855 RepID=UPI001962169D|nr:GTPase HflX [Marinitoga litoralis]MBM7560377.1 GTP-binding protein HflX [Marinitoga litoralis]